MPARIIWRWITSAILGLALFGLPAPALAQSPQVIEPDATRYMALGDSIAAGYKLAPITEGYAYLLYQDGVFDRMPHTLFNDIAAVGATSDDFRARLAQLCQQAGRRRVGQTIVWVGTCGIHRCDFCNHPSAVSSKEIRIRGTMRTYAAPELIDHYVAAHSYLPPSEFIDAVLAWDGEIYQEPDDDLSCWKRRLRSPRRPAGAV